jgi:hypothetical protein
MLIRDSESYRRDALVGGAKVKGVDYRLVDRMVFQSVYGKLLGRLAYRLFRVAARCVRLACRGESGPRNKVLRVLWLAGQAQPG